MLLFITKRRGPGSEKEDEKFTVEIDCNSTFGDVKEMIKGMTGIAVQKQFLWCKTCSGTQFENSDTLKNPELDPSELLLFVNEDKVGVDVFLCPLVEYNPWHLTLDLVDSVKDLEALIMEKRDSWWNQDIHGYNKTIWMELLDRKHRKVLQESVLLEDLQAEQISEDNTDTVQVYCAIKVHLFLQNNEIGVGEVRTLNIKLSDVNMAINIEIEGNKTVKDLKDAVLPLVDHRYIAFWFYQEGAPLSMEMLVKDLISNKILLK